LKFEFAARSSVTVLFSVFTVWEFSRYIVLLEDSPEMSVMFVAGAPEALLSDRTVDAVWDVPGRTGQTETARFTSLLIVARRYTILLQSKTDRPEIIDRRTRRTGASNRTVDAVSLAHGQALRIFVWQTHVDFLVQLRCHGDEWRLNVTRCVLLLLCCVRAPCQPSHLVFVLCVCAGWLVAGCRIRILKYGDHAMNC
jgi:hypothetical protein